MKSGGIGWKLVRLGWTLGTSGSKLAEIGSTPALFDTRFVRSGSKFAVSAVRPVAAVIGGRSGIPGCFGMTDIPTMRHHFAVRIGFLDSGPSCCRSQWSS